MADHRLVGRLAALPAFASLPTEELRWLVDHGRLQVREAGAVVAPKGRRIQELWIILSGHVAVRVDRGVGPKRVIDWRAGDVSGMLPYSRMTGPPGDNYLEEKSELLTIHEDLFPEMAHRCPRFTAYTVHMMLDRARRFNTSDLQDEKMVSLGKLAAGLAHELNNPASATVRGAKVLLSTLAEADASARALGAARLTDRELALVNELHAVCTTSLEATPLSPLERADREDRLAVWLDDHGVDAGFAAPLTDAGVSPETLGPLIGGIPDEAFEAALRWVAVGCSTRALAADVERAATRIHELVSTVKRFTYMDTVSGPEAVDVAPGLRDTVRISAAKAKAKGVTVTLDVPEDLPPAHASGGELNQVWMNLLDNALDAVPESGHIDISARPELDRIVIRFVDDGPGVDPDVLPFLFDPFFTTKPPGQGTGLGLDISRRLLRRFHGEIAVESRPGRTEFRVSLPVDLGESRPGKDASEEGVRR
jgi:signal transduction histidine kinase